MIVPSTLSKTFSTAGQKAAYDNACKKLLSNKIILAWIMKSCLPEYRDCTVQEIAEKYIEGEPHISEIAVHQDEQLETVPLLKGLNTEDNTICEGTITYDIRFRAVAPVSGKLIQLIINVEGQNIFSPGYPLIKRSIYYCSRMISSQYGTEFTNSHYENIRKVYSIFICMNSPQYRKNTINYYSLQERNIIGNAHEKKENYDLITAIIICLGDKNHEADSGILRLLEVLLSSERDAEEKRHILQHDYDIPMTERIESEVSEMCNLSEGIEQRGIQKERLNSIQNLMKNLKLPLEQAMAALGIPKDEWETYRSLRNDMKQN
nr:hypothetical protein [uncultured Blautia sp.]